jgi:hypothetical protein
MPGVAAARAGTYAERSAVPDQGRPRFLPPEEPSPAPAAAPDAATAPPGPRSRGPVVGALTALTLLIATGAGVLLYHARPDDSRPAASSSPRPAGSPADLAPAYTRLPDPCTATAGALPADIRSVKPRRALDSCRWQLLRQDRSRILQVELNLKTDDPITGPGTAGAAKVFAGDLAYAADTTQNGGYESSPERLTGLGEDAFTARSSNLIVYGRTEQEFTSYDLGGALAEARARNVVVTVTWQGADYPRGVRGHRRLTGQRLPYADAKRQAIAILRAILGKLG